jgi:drug/metabolite transporter (DMT)-like permease
MPVSAPRSVLLTPRTALLLVGINALWGGSSLAAKSALSAVPPFTLAFVRFSLSAVLLYTLAGVLRIDLRVARRDWGLFWAIGALGLALTYLLVYVGLARTTAADSALIHAAEPVFLAVLSVVFLRERMGRPKVLGVVVGFVGVLLVVAREGFRLSGGTIGDLLIALGLVCESLAIIVSKRLIARYPPLTVLTYQMLTGAVILAPCAAWEGARHGWQLPVGLWSGPVLLSLLYLILLCTVLAYTVWYGLLDTYAASDLSVFLFVQPIVGAALGVLFQHDPLTPTTIAGAVLVLLALGLLHRSSLPDPLPPA